MNEVLQAIEKIKGTEARRKILIGIVNNKLTIPKYKKIALDLLNENKFYDTRTLEQQKEHRAVNKVKQQEKRNINKN